MDVITYPLQGLHYWYAGSVRVKQLASHAATQLAISNISTWSALWRLFRKDMAAKMTPLGIWRIFEPKIRKGRWKNGNLFDVLRLVSWWCHSCHVTMHAKLYNTLHPCCLSRMTHAICWWGWVLYISLVCGYLMLMLFKKQKKSTLNDNVFIFEAADHHEKSLYFHCSSTPCEK